LILYAGLVILRVPEETLLSMTPRKFTSLMRVHKLVNTVEGTETTKSKKVYIDQIL